jgi:hypothetical protein
MTAQVFFGYASEPELSRETLYSASTEVASTGLVEATSWESLKVGGRVVMTAIFEAIDDSQLAAFDVSTLNENVLFEVGYAIGRAKGIWLLLDTTDAEAKQRWKQFRLLSSVGYVGWVNAEDIKVAFLRDQPHQSESTIFDDLIEPNLTPPIGASIFYFPSFHDTEASKELGRRLDAEVKRGIRLLSADPTESAINPLAWYAEKANGTSGTVVHFEASRRELAPLHNARAALVAGMAHGMEKPVLMLAEEDYSAPFDYQDMLKPYRSARECRRYADEWLQGLDLRPDPGLRSQRLQQVTELRGLRFGEHVAENEVDGLSEYFVETAGFDQVMASRNTLFVGRKGAGKTANMYQASARLQEDARNLVAVIKPATYEFESLLSFLTGLPRDLRSYSIEALWKFLLQSEIAKCAVEVAESRPSGVPLSTEEQELVSFVNTTDFGLREEFAVRFERTVIALESSELPAKLTVGTGRDLINELLHVTALRDLRRLVGAVLKGRNRVAILIDNLDKAWDRAVDLELLSHLLLGLLGAVGRVATDYEKESYWRDRVSLTLATFLRTDIYSYLQRIAREPDKIPVTYLEWADPNVLVRVIEERFLATRPDGTDPQELWTRFFCPTVKGTPTRDYVLQRVLPRPRDLIYLFNAAVISAVNSRRERVEEEDVLNAEGNYSQFAFEALLVENGLTIMQFEAVLFEFIGLNAVLEVSEAVKAIKTAGVEDDKVEEVLTRLKALSFLGTEVAPNQFRYAEAGPEMQRVEVFARRLAERRGDGEARLTVHPAFRAYLGISE